MIDAQLRLHFTPHWKSVAKKNDKLHADTITIITQLALLNARTWPKIRRQRIKMESFIRPKAIYSVVWNPCLYCESDISYLRRRRVESLNISFLLGILFSAEIGQSFTTGEWPVMTCCTQPDITEYEKSQHSKMLVEHTSKK